MDDGVNQKAVCVGDDMALFALNFLACIITPNTAAFRCFNGLTVDYSGIG